MASYKSAKRKEKARVYAAALSDLTTRDVEVEVERPGDDAIVVIPMHTLSYGEWMQVEIDYPPPIPQVVGGLTGQTVMDKDPEYLKARGEWNTKIMYVRIVRALRIPFKGTTEEEKIAEVKAMDTIYVNALINASWQAHMTGEARVIARAESFRPNGASHPPSLRPEGERPDVVAQPAGVGTDGISGGGSEA